MNMSNIIDFIERDVWRIRSKDLSRRRFFLIRQLRIILLVIRGFQDDKCQLKASALTFFTLLSIVPVAALAFGIAKGFGLEKFLETQILQNIPGQEQVLMQIMQFAQQLLEQTKGGVIAGIGVIVLFWTVISVLGNIEYSFDDIWGIKQPRSMGRKFSDYLSVVLICPLLIIVSSSVTVFITTQIALITSKIAILGAFQHVIFFVLKFFFTYFMIWVLFTFLYIFMPNTKVNFLSGLIGGIVAGTIYQLVQAAYIVFQIGVVQYNAIYGSFAALPLFLVWLQLSWLIVLLGAEISFAHQNVDTYEFEHDCLSASVSFKKVISLWITHALVKNFVQGGEPLTAQKISHVLDIPIRLVRQIIFELRECNIVSESKTWKSNELAYQPARDVDDFTIGYVLNTLDHRGVDTIPVADTSEYKYFSTAVKKFQEVISKTSENRLLKEI